MGRGGDKNQLQERERKYQTKRIKMSGQDGVDIRLVRVSTVDGEAGWVRIRNDGDVLGDQPVPIWKVVLIGVALFVLITIIIVLLVLFVMLFSELI